MFGLADVPNADSVRVRGVSERKPDIDRTVCDHFGRSEGRAIRITSRHSDRTAIHHKLNVRQKQCIGRSSAAGDMGDWKKDTEGPTAAAAS